MINATIKELQLAAELLIMAQEKFSYHGCNDLPKNFFDALTDAEKAKLLEEMNQGKHVSDHITDVKYIQDWVLMSFFADKLNNA
jgi:hypothetical protein